MTCMQHFTRKLLENIKRYRSIDNHIIRGNNIVLKKRKKKKKKNISMVDKRNRRRRI